MKKQIFGIAALALAGVMSFGLAACGKSGGKDEFSAKVEAIEGKEVTAAQWAAALERLNNDDAELAIEVASVITVEGKKKNPENGKKISMYTKQTDVYEKAAKGTKTHWKVTQAMEYGEEYKKYFIQQAEDLEEYECDDWVRETELYGEETSDGYFYYGKNADGAWEKGDSPTLYDNDNVDVFYAEEIKDGFLYSYAENEEYRDFGDYVYSTEHKGYIREIENCVLDDYYEDGWIEYWNELQVIKFDESGRIVAAMTIWWSDATDLSGEGNGSLPLAYKAVCTWIFTYEVEDIILPAVA